MGRSATMGEAGSALARAVGRRALGPPNWALKPPGPPNVNTVYQHE